MNPLIEENRPQLEELCRLHGVRRIELFGSAAGSAFDPERSDLDFLVSFRELGPGRYADAYFGLLDSAFRNPYFRQTVDSTRTLIYTD